MFKHTQTICRQKLTNCLNVFDYFVRLALKRLKTWFSPPRVFVSNSGWVHFCLKTEEWQNKLTIPCLNLSWKMVTYTLKTWRCSHCKIHLILEVTFSNDPLPEIGLHSRETRFCTLCKIVYKRLYNCEYTVWN